MSTCQLSRARRRTRRAAVLTTVASIAVAVPLAAGGMLSSAGAGPVAPHSVGVLTPNSLTTLSAGAGGVISLNGTQTIRNTYVRGHIYWNSQGGTLTIENSIIEGGYGSWGILSGDGTGRLVITDSTFRWRAGTPPPSTGAIGSGAVQSYSWETDILRADISGLGDGVKIGTSNSSIVDSWIRDLAVVQGLTHNDCVQIAAGTNIEIRGNRMDCPNVTNSGNSAIFLQGSGIGTVTIEDNYLSGGAYSLYVQHGQVYANRNQFGPSIFGSWWGTFASFVDNVVVGSTPPPTTAPPTTAPPTTAPPVTAPPTTAPPVTAPPTTAPPTTAVPGITPVTMPPTPVTPTPTTAPPATVPPTTAPPATAPPATVPPATAPPATLPPATAPPATLPPATAPPATAPPATVPPTTAPAPTTAPPSTPPTTVRPNGRTPRRPPVVRQPRRPVVSRATQRTERRPVATPARRTASMQRAR